MPAVEGLGRQFNIVPIAAGASLSLRNSAGVTFICTGNDTFTLTVASAFAGSFATPGNIIVRKFTSTATNGTAAWVLATQTASNAVTIASGAVAIFVSNESLPDGKTHIKCTASAAGLVTAVFAGLYAQRQPSNLAAIGA